MRVNFTQSILEVFKKDDKAIFITGDLGFNALEELKSSFPDRFINAGVAEQNMVGMAAGMALSGYHPWIYSIAPFAVYRCFEQIRNDMCLHNLPICIVGNGGGYTYGVMGSTHHALEDLGVLKTLPNIDLYFPCTNSDVDNCVKQIMNNKKPSYLRLGISGFPSDLKAMQSNEYLNKYLDGELITVIGVGQGVQPAIVAFKDNDGIADVFGVHKFNLKLASVIDLIKSINKTKKILFIDEHYKNGSITESLIECLPKVKYDIMCAKYDKDQLYGSNSFHLNQSEINPDIIVKKVYSLINK